MRYMSLDIETGGLDFEECDILSFCAILDDLSDPRPLEELPVLNCMFTKNTAYKGQPGGLAMNSDLLLKIAKAIKSGTKEDEDGIVEAKSSPANGTNWTLVWVVVGITLAVILIAWLMYRNRK